MPTHECNTWQAHWAMCLSIVLMVAHRRGLGLALVLVQTQRPTGQQSGCYKCGKTGHWSRDCTAPRELWIPQRPIHPDAAAPRTAAATDTPQPGTDENDAPLPGFVPPCVPVIILPPFKQSSSNRLLASQHGCRVQHQLGQLCLCWSAIGLTICSS